MLNEEDEVYLEWLAAAPKGVRWDKAQEMYQVYQERRRKQAEIVAKRLLGNIRTVDFPAAGQFPVEEISESFWDGSKRILYRRNDGN